MQCAIDFRTARAKRARSLATRCVKQNTENILRVYLFAIPFFHANVFIVVVVVASSFVYVCMLLLASNPYKVLCSYRIQRQLNFE